MGTTVGWPGEMAATTLVCGSCGAEPPLNSKLCNECGAAVMAHNTHAEYKQVTVLFADVVHSMDIAATVGAERLREIMSDLADRCAAVVQRYGGTVDKFTGDGIMAVFGRRQRWKTTPSGLAGRLWTSSKKRVAWALRCNAATT